MRLSGQRAFSAVYAARLRRSMGPIAVCAKPNGLTHCRLGLSVPRKVGNAVKRSGIKRRLREAFRLHQHELPVGYDLIVVVRPHEPETVESYAALLVKAAHKLNTLAQKRAEPSPDSSPPPADMV